ncbi:MAG TPA: shikimate dehydrogenase [Hyphomicrobiaceae bacterium]|nr:shikimate dehydrogenase [Hyphomicrobiaceae bacterium]
MRRACVVGWPVSHSRSPLIHGYWLDRYGIAGSYERVAVRPEEASGVLSNLRSLGYVGCNVTIPHKETAFRVADETLPAARAAAAANTLWYEGGRLLADNTDGLGFVSNVRSAVPAFHFHGAIVSLLGAGGAARGIAYALLEAGVAEIRVFNRTRARAEALAAAFGKRVVPLDWGERSARSDAASLLINTTPLGMVHGGDALDLDLSALDPGCVVADIVYVPLVTPLLAAARARGLATVDGLGMLLHQAVPGFERWFGVRPEVTEDLRALIVGDIEGAGQC